MPDVIDSFVVELGLDPTKFTEGQKAALESFRKTQKEALQGAKDIEESSRRTLLSISSMRTQAVSAVAAVFGASTITSFIGNQVALGAELNRTSRAIGVNAQEISRWQGVAQEFGSTGENMASTFKSMSDAFTAWHTGGPEGPAIMQAIRQINTAADALDPKNAVIIDDQHGVNGYLVSLAKNLKIIRELSSDPNMASYLAGKLPNMDSGMIDLLSRGADVLAEKLAKVRGVTLEEAEAAGKLEQRWNALKVSATNLAQSGLFALIDSKTMFNPFENGSDAKDIKSIASWFGLDKNLPKLFPALFEQPVPLTPSQIATTSYGRGGFKSQAEKEAFIRAEASRRGVDPNVAMFGARKEGFNQFGGDIVDGKATSFGAFQLHVTPGGRGNAIGDQFQRTTGLDPSNPANERATIIFALENLKRTGWTPYHGPSNAGIGQWQGIDRNAPPVNSSSSSTSVTISGPITINAGPNASASEIANKLRELGMQRQAENTQSSVGAN